MTKAEADSLQTGDFIISVRGELWRIVKVLDLQDGGVYTQYVHPDLYNGKSYLYIEGPALLDNDIQRLMYKTRNM
jgi:hypothetical protein